MKPVTSKARGFEDFAPKGGGAELFEKVRQLGEELKRHRHACLDGLGVQLLGAADRRVGVREHDGAEHDVIMLGSNSYLSMTTHPQVVAASKAACERYGFGMGAVSLYAGTTDLHRELEQRIAAFYGEEDALLFPCGYTTNVGVVSAMCGPGDVVINDAANHASIFDGCALSGAEVKVFVHRNMRHLERVLKGLPDSQRGRLIITDGVFSMDGDVAYLDRMVELAEQYGARLMVDEAHAVGVIGATGRGTAERRGCMGRVDITIGTLSKAPAAIGGYCVGSAALIRYLRYFARTYFFSTSLPAPVVAGLIEVFKLFESDTAGREELWEKTTYMRSGLQRLGFDTGETESPIIPVMVGDEEVLAEFHNGLRRRGVFTSLVTYPAVRRRACRLRVSVMTALTYDDLDMALTVFGSLGRELGIVATREEGLRKEEVAVA